MGFKKIINSVLIMGTALVMLQSCGSSKVSSSQGGFYHSGIYFDYQQGIVDGCKTAKGYYSKSHTLFRHNGDYNHGWFLGRNRCKHLLKINENGDLIS